MQVWVWACLIIVFSTLMIYWCSSVYIGLNENITVTTLDDSHYPISEIALPAIAICSNNKLSKQRVIDFVNRLSPRVNKSEEWLFQQILWLGKLHDFNFYGDDQRIELQEIIDEVIGDQVSFNDIRDFMGLMYSLAVPCDQLLVECNWLGNTYNCNQLFESRITMDGFCCLFNYVRPFIYPGNFSGKRNMSLVSLNSREDSKHFNMHMGLKFVIDNKPEDYLYTDLMLKGVIVKIFPQDIFPDSAGGDVVDIFCGQDEEIFLNLETSHIQATEELKYYSKSVRGCVLSDEPTIKYGTSTLSDCLVNCKIRTLLSLCRCIPFNLNFEGIHPICTILDLPCLHKYKEKLSTWYPSTITTDELEHEKEDSMKCDCYPTCTRTKYKVYARRAFLNKQFQKGQTFIHIYYGNTIMNLYKTDISMYWFELLSKFGGLCGIILGVTVISIFEIVYLIISYICQVALIFIRKIKMDSIKA